MLAIWLQSSRSLSMISSFALLERASCDVDVTWPLQRLQICCSDSFLRFSDWFPMCFTKLKSFDTAEPGLSIVSSCFVGESSLWWISFLLLLICKLSEWPRSCFLSFSSLASSSLWCVPFIWAPLVSGLTDAEVSWLLTPSDLFSRLPPSCNASFSLSSPFRWVSFAGSELPSSFSDLFAAACKWRFLELQPEHEVQSLTIYGRHGDW